jgi:hypothetical protein
MLYSIQHSPAWDAAAARSIVLLTEAPAGFNAATVGCCAAAHQKENHSVKVCELIETQVENTRQQ